MRAPWACAPALLLAVLASCAQQSRPAPTPTPATLPRLDAFHGSYLVITLPPNQPAPPARTDAHLDDGTTLDARPFTISTALPQGVTAQSWITPSDVWTSSPVIRTDETPARHVIVVNLPESSDGRVLTVNNTQYLLNWLPGITLLPAPVDTPPEPILNPWRPVIEGDLARNTRLLRHLNEEASNPLMRWRFHLCLNGLNPLAQDSGAKAFDDPAIEAIAHQSEDRWRVALGGLWTTNPELTWRLKRRLAAIIDFGNGVFAPAWPTDLTALDRLLADLLDQSITPARRAELAESWLSEQPAGHAWVIDDESTFDDRGGMLLAAVGFVNLGDHTTRAWVDAPTPGETEFHPLTTHSAMSLLVPVPRDEQNAPLITPLSVHVGRWSSDMPVLCRAIPVQPPGFTIGPLLRDYTMQTWSEGPGADERLVPSPEWTTAALLHRPPLDPTAPPSSVESRRWELLVECRMGSGKNDLEALKREQVRLYFGPTSRPSAILCVDLTGKVVNEAPTDSMLPAEMTPPPGHVDITRAFDRWCFRISLPPGAVEQGGVVRLGMVRTDARGARTTWPRPLLPWLTAPGRAPLTVSAWSGKSE